MAKITIATHPVDPMNEKLEIAFRKYNSIEDLFLKEIFSPNGELNLIEYTLKHKFTEVLSRLNNLGYYIFNLVPKDIEGERILKDFVSKLKLQQLDKSDIFNIAFYLTNSPEDHIEQDNLKTEIIISLTNDAILSSLGKAILEEFICKIMKISPVFYEPQKKALQDIFKKHSEYINEYLNYKVEPEKSLLQQALINTLNFMPFYISTPLITEDIMGVEPVVNKMLKNTYIDTTDSGERGIIIEQLIKGLKLVMDRESTISDLLKTAFGYSTIYLYMANLTTMDAGGYYSGRLDKPEIVIGNAKTLLVEDSFSIDIMSGMAKFFGTLVHEHIHLLLHMLYTHPGMEPFAVEDRDVSQTFTVIKDEIINLYKNEKALSGSAERLIIKSILQHLSAFLQPINAKIVLSFLLNDHSSTSTSDLIYQEA